MQNSIWFTSDTHLDHKKLDLLKRSFFSSVDHMNSVIIDNWNSVVKPNDTVYHLGDFAFSDHDPFLNRMHGIKILLPGNHDNSKRLKKAKDWHSIEPPIKEIKVGDQVIVLCHYAMRTWHRSHHGTLHLYGHSHGNLPGDSQSCDVGVDVWDFKPVDLVSVMLRMKSHVKRVEIDHHQKG